MSKAGDSKKIRQAKIEGLFRENPKGFKSLTNIRHKLKMEISESTLSRDLNELNIYKIDGQFKLAPADYDAHRMKVLEKIFEDFSVRLIEDIHIVGLETKLSAAEYVAARVEEALPQLIKGSLTNGNMVLFAVSGKENYRMLSQRIRELGANEEKDINRLTEI